MMLDGLMCEGCGEWMGDFDAPGYARRCAACEPNEGHPAPGDWPKVRVKTAAQIRRARRRRLIRKERKRAAKLRAAQETRHGG